MSASLHDAMPSTSALSLLAFDFGTRRIGVASGNTVTGQATPLTTLHETLRSLAGTLVAFGAGVSTAVVAGTA